jgi:hypothetical protein
MNYEKYYTPEQLDQLAERRARVGESRIQEVRNEWQELFAAYERAMSAGVDPATAEVQALARKSAALIAEFTGSNSRIAASLDTMYREQGQKPLEGHIRMAPGLWEYMGKARAAFEASR